MVQHIRFILHGLIQATEARYRIEGGIAVAAVYAGKCVFLEGSSLSREVFGHTIKRNIGSALRQFPSVQTRSLLFVRLRYTRNTMLRYFLPKCQLETCFRPLVIREITV